ncbi:stage III sporulation protein AF [Clostridium chauvoei]|uniref:Stage III sporulation protein AF n=2 Tax=Clostridium chauvoei TaxID=46867 RepID=A0ABD4RE17_9CLOT|nr:stage III sporulation protein AF [Clostridium chauvoei]ATD55194.1 stage III sporulation protein AF [Clostridium chauvoei]ATD57134.1 stage III sporulation protein AF [Clostridium chauvoei]MBX7279538.1 stage III sporulation protein AF [Clostridium chauvoei]MBX7281907.1 stage III sporulation protein AF [Clostridium chauvoei]MBX7284504.1 stage III sporulation protein AF [Clostridium chauvoei]
METLTNFVVTLVTMIILMTAIELIAPDNSIKKYLKFVLGLILISVMLTPIISLISKGEKQITSAISKYTENPLDSIKKDNDNSVNQTKEKTFEKNLEKNCEKILKSQFTNRDFQSEVTCNLDLENMTYSIDKVSIGVKDKSIKKVQKIEINTKENVSEALALDDKVENEEEIKKYIGEALNIQADKIEIYSIDR